MRFQFSIVLGAAALCAAAVAPVQHTDYGRIDRLYVYSPEMKDTIPVDVWLPESYISNAADSLPVIYMHDGQNLYDRTTTWNGQAWEVDSTAQTLIGRGMMAPVMVVGIHSFSETRTSDLMPQNAFEGEEESKAVAEFLKYPMRGNAYAKFVSTTLRDTINSRYRTLTQPENTAVMGSSMGGLMSIYILCEYPEIFGKAACLSTHWIGGVEAYQNGDERFPQAMYRYIEKKLPRDGSHQLYFDRGTATLDANYGKWDARIIRLIRDAGYTPRTLSTYIAPGAAHEENAWKARLPRPLQYLFPAE